jgi:citronellol/citronellal dehydrogenase
VEELGQAALPVQCDIRDEAAIEAGVQLVVDAFGRIDILINNASALWWQDITDTPMSKFDLITQINVRGTFAMTAACLPHMEEHGFGRIINMSPPIKLDPGAYVGMTAYNISKYPLWTAALIKHDRSMAWFCCVFNLIYPQLLAGAGTG